MKDPRPLTRHPPVLPWLRFLAAIAGPAAVTLLAIPEARPSTAVVAVLYVLAIVIAARVGGAAAGALASLLSFLSLNFFFTPPIHTFAVGTVEDLASLLVFLVVSVIVGVLFSSAVAAKARTERRELEARLLNRLATRLLSGEPPEKALASFGGGICDLFGLSRCEIETEFTDTLVINRRKVGTNEAPREVRLVARGKKVGVIRIWLDSSARFDEDEARVIESLATQLALALEGMRLSLEVRRAELEVSASRLKAALFSGVTHDVKTPLAAIMAAVTSLVDGSGFSDTERREHLDSIQQEAERLHRVVNNLLDVARHQAGALVAKKVPSPIDELMESVTSRLRPLLEDRELEIRVGDDVPEIPMDVVQIDQVLTNLIENSIKFTSQRGGAISLSAVGHVGGVRITVSDNGPGIPKTDRIRVLEPFETGGSAKAGTGLGLTITNAIVIAHGGRMWISETPSGGAAITFELPLAESGVFEAVDG